MPGRVPSLPLDEFPPVISLKGKHVSGRSELCRGSGLSVNQPPKKESQIKTATQPPKRVANEDAARMKAPGPSDPP